MISRGPRDNESKVRADARTERGGALIPAKPARWYAIWTRSHSEQLVADQLAAKGLSVFLPKISVWSRRGGVRRLIQVPMFSGYVFLHESVDKNVYIEVIKARGVVRLLGDNWDSLCAIPDSEIEALQTVLESGLAVTPHSYFREGQQVRITAGPLKGVDGVLVENKLEKGLLVISVDLLQRSVAVQIDCTWVAAA
ncbi:MAG TPA: UpxY family transcription antiterminator [Thermoanaerobaculia bacterium]|nr:UpxY family transcription antiterminator [Thermoanaerobaculia bacterium]